MNAATTEPDDRAARPIARGAERRWSRGLIVATALCLAAGVILGAVAAPPDAPAPEHEPSLNAWPAHIAVTVAVVAALAGWAWWTHRTTGRPADLMAPWRGSTIRRLAATMAAIPRGRAQQRIGAFLRALVVLVVTALLFYLLFRLGFQITFTRGAAQTVNAWGGPSYLGAFYAHFIDAVATALVALGVAHRAAQRAATTTASPEDR